MSDLHDRLDKGEVIILDGAMGTELQARGVPMDRAAWAGAALATHPEVIQEIHEDYIRAGADVIITNTFGAARHVLEAIDLDERFPELIHRAVALAEEAIARVAEGRRVWIAGSISNFAAENVADNTPPPEVAKANYREQSELLAEAGADLITLEMMHDTEQSRYAIEAAAATGLPVWVGFSCKIGADGETVVFWGPGPEVSFEDSFDLLMSAGGTLAGVMHSEIETMEPALDIVLEKWPGSVAAYPHRGHFIMPEWQFVDAISPEDYLAEAKKWVAMGAQVIGGCCGIGPDHIRLLKEKLPKKVPA